MKWDMPIRPIESGPLTRREIKELDGFLLAEDLKNPMDFFTFDGFICAVLSGPNTIMPSQWLRWVWDQEEGEQQFPAEGSPTSPLHIPESDRDDAACAARLPQDATGPTWFPLGS